MALPAKVATRTFVALGIALLPLMVALPATAQSYSILHTFGGLADQDGWSPFGGLIADSSGNFYGTTQYGGALSGDGFGYGTVYELPANGGEKVLYYFTGTTDGATPTGALIADSAGNLYGTAETGGDLKCGVQTGGCGVVFKLSPQGTETVLYTFTGRGDGAYPAGGLIRDAAGNLYGTATQGGRTGRSCFQVGCGVVFMLNPAGQETILHTFTGPPDGQTPMGSLVQDAAGNLYGTTLQGGAGCRTSAYGCGTVYKLDPNGNVTILYSFTQESDGGSPQSGLLLDPAGNLYGTTTNGGANLSCRLGNTTGCGVVFKVDPSGNETVLYTFPGGAAGAVPFASLVRDPKGNLYGAAAAGGSFSGFYAGGCGVVFKLTPTGYATVLHSFQLTDGCGPLANLLTYNGYLYGTTGGGGVNGASSFGVVFQLQP
jgi:uncharacterized repeat protein (TIGR03803 family)